MSQQAIDTHYAWDTERHQWKALEYDGMFYIPRDIIDDYLYSSSYS
jgi:hypothetical protein